MEDFILFMHQAEECFKKNQISLLKSDDKEELKTTCLAEKNKLIELIVGERLRTSNLIPDRLETIKKKAEKKKLENLATLDTKL
jgi:hypothetical protein